MVSDTTVLGKRKRVKQPPPPQKQPQSADKAEADEAAAAERAALEEAQAIFRRHFEAQFVPLQESEKGTSGSAGKKGRKEKAGKDSDEADEDDGGQPGVEDLRSDSEDEDDDDWDGLSGEDDDEDEDDDSENDGEDDDLEADSGEETANKVEVVDHSKPLAPSLTPQALMGMTKREMRAYLSSRPPDALSSAEASKAKQLLLKKDDGDGAGDGADGGQAEDSKALLAKDLELQRLISESHILSSANPFNTTTSGAARLAFAGGRARALTTDLRLQGLGGKGSIFSQQRMPMGMRKGITGAKAAREERRRREAKENGIILERPAAAGDGGAAGKAKKGKKKSTFGRRDLPVDMPGMGRMKGGELRLNKRDVKAVENEGKRFDGKRKKKRR